MSLKKTKIGIVRHLALLFILIIAFSCKEEIIIEPSLNGYVWHLIEIREKPTCCNQVKFFKWQTFDSEEYGSGGINYKFESDTVTEYNIPCQTCYRGVLIHTAKFSRDGDKLKIEYDNKNRMLIYGNFGNFITKLTNDTLVMGSSYGREGDYSEFKFVKLKK